MSIGFTVGERGGVASAGTTFVKRKYVNIPRLTDPKRKTPLTRTGFCKIKVFHYLQQNFGPASDLRARVDPSDFLQVNTFEVTDAVASLTVGKSLSQASGTFEFTLFPTQNWKGMIAPGDWLAIYMYGENESGQTLSGSENMLLLGNVDRIARVLAKEEETDKTTLRFHVSGRNFGKVFETTEVFYDPYSVQRTTLDVALQTAGMLMIGTPDHQIRTTLDIFIGQGATIQDKIVSPLGQWMLPLDVTGLFAAITGGETATATPGLSDILNRFIDQVPGYKVDTAITPDDNGNLWELLKRMGNLVVNEVFVEESRLAGHLTMPALVFRPRPLQSPFFANNCGQYFEKVNATLNGAYKSLQQLAQESFLELSPTEIVHEDLGRDDHSRFNLFWFEVPAAAQYMVTAISKMSPVDGITNPMVIRESLNRHGMRLFDQMVEFCQPLNSPTSNIQSDLLQAFMAQVYDQNYANHMYESGTIECTGVLEAELGKVLVVLPNRNGVEQQRLFYIEGYEHRWSYPSHWTTTFMVTHGQFVNDNWTPFIDASQDDYGAPDTEISQGYLSQSTITRK